MTRQLIHINFFDLTFCRPPHFVRIQCSFELHIVLYLNQNKISSSVEFCDLAEIISFFVTMC